MTGQLVFAADVRGQGGEDVEGMLKATGRATGVKQVQIHGTAWLLSQPYNKWMLVRTLRRSGNNGHRKAHKLALLSLMGLYTKSRNIDKTKHTS